MGANCCVAARDKTLPDRISHEISTYRNVRHSPSWSFRWDNRTHIEDIMENRAQFSHHNSGNATSEAKSTADTETDGFSDNDESPPKAFQPAKWRKTIRTGGSENKFVDEGQPAGSNLFSEVKRSMESSFLPSASDVKLSVSIPASSPPTLKMDDPSSSGVGFTPFETTSRKARRSPGFQLCRQISDSRIPSLKSLNEGSSPEGGRHSFVLSNDLSAGGSHGGSSDGWSMRTFSELVASSQRERWSFDSETLAFSGKICGSGMYPKSFHSPDLQSCNICSKLLKEKSPWSTHKIVSTNDLPVAAVLVCGHVFHAECLESSTLEIERYDPACPVCINNGERLVLKPLGKSELKGRNKMSRIAVADDTNVDGDSTSRPCRSGKRPIIASSSSMKSSFGRPFLRRHFSMGPRPVRSASENESTRKKGFWARYRRE